jgi:tRNA G18 (ribose-2'-O)-methylase SpoU
LAGIERKPIYIVLDNVLDTYNIGSIFRLADAVAASEVILCGGSETPPSSRIHKAAVGTEEWVKWRYCKSAADFLKDFTGKIVVVEQDSRSIPLSQLQPTSEPVAIVVGHETQGVSQEVLDFANTIVEIPMFGVNKSLNVVVSTGIALYKVLGLS